MSYVSAASAIALVALAGAWVAQDRPVVGPAIAIALGGVLCALALATDSTTQHHIAAKYRRNSGFSLIQMLVVLAIIAGLAMATLSGVQQAKENVVKRNAQAREASRVSLVEQAWADRGINGPESARLELARIILTAQGVDTATVTDWTPAGLAARTPAVEPPMWTTPEAMALAGIAEPVIPHQ